MTTTQLFDPKTVSEMLKIPPSTLRRYCKSYIDYLSPTAREKSKKRRFSDTDILVLKNVRELTASKKTEDEIKIALQVIQDNPDQEAQLNAIETIYPQIIEIIDQFRAKQASLEDRVSQLETKLEYMPQLEAELEYLRLPWLKRLRTPKPNKDR
jgi:DNA-binding transcriptional MerR regulator